MQMYRTVKANKFKEHHVEQPSTTAFQGNPNSHADLKRIPLELFNKT